MTDVRCAQCEGELVEGEPLAAMLGWCDGCMAIHQVGWVHLIICAPDLSRGEPTQASQRRRAGYMRLN